MRFSCQVRQDGDGQWLARHTGTDVGTVEVTAASRPQALAKMRDELRYRLEYCPCSGEMYRDVVIEIVDAPGGLMSP